MSWTAGGEVAAGFEVAGEAEEGGDEANHLEKRVRMLAIIVKQEISVESSGWVRRMCRDATAQPSARYFNVGTDNGLSRHLPTAGLSAFLVSYLG